MASISQEALFNEIKARLSPNQSLVNELSEILGVSLDSAYRRIRGEKQLNLAELSVLVDRFGISMDSLLHLKSNTLLFHYQTLNKENPKYIDFLNTIYKDIQPLSSISGSEVIIAAKDFPIFYNFFIPEIAGFKSFFWKKTILQLPEFKQIRFNIDDIVNAEIEIGQKISHTFCMLRTQQLWNEEVFTSFTNQVIYYYESGFMTDKNTVQYLLEKILDLLNHFQSMAEQGAHFLPGKSAMTADSFQLYQNDVIFGDNTIIVNTPNISRVYFTHNVIDTLYSNDANFVNHTTITHQNIINRSLLLSKSSERERNRFFKLIRDKVQMRINSIL